MLESSFRAERLDLRLVLWFLAYALGVVTDLRATIYSPLVILPVPSH